MAQREADLLTEAEYARHRKAHGLPGGSREAVNRAVREGRISTIGGKIHPLIADAEWAKNTRARMSPQAAAAPAEDDLVGQAAAAASLPAAAPAAAPAPAAQDSGYTLARTRHEAAEAEQAEIELRRKKGELVLREDVDRAFVEISRELRDRLMACGRRTAAECAALTSAEACEAVIDREHRIVLELLVTGFRERVGAPPGAAA